MDSLQSPEEITCDLCARFAPCFVAIHNCTSHYDVIRSIYLRFFLLPIDRSNEC